MRVLIADDEPGIRSMLRMCVESAGHAVVDASSADEALRATEAERIDLAFVDMRLGTDDGLELIPALLRRCPNLTIVVITAYATVATAVSAIQRGAADYLPKPFTPAQIRLHLERHVERARLEARVVDLERAVDDALPGVLLASRAPAMRRVVELLERAARSDAPILLRGESGTGKGVLARHVHACSERHERPFVTVSCPTLSPDLLASDLFGHARGAFTGAVRDHRGKVEAADGGTLFLDEIAELAPALQAKLLRFTHDRSFERVGETRVRHANVRIVSATNRDIEGAIDAGSFRLDLLYRLNVIEVTVPPLRERRDDLPELARHFLAFYGRGTHGGPPELTEEALETLRAYPWPGNIRELRNEMERATILALGGPLTPQSFSHRIATSGATTRLFPVGGAVNVSLDELEREHIRRVLDEAPTLEEAARILGIDPSTLWRKRRRYHLDD